MKTMVLLSWTLRQYECDGRVAEMERAMERKGLWMESQGRGEWK
jgi:hypothetical protein